MLKKLSLVFSAGAVGALANSLVLWLLGLTGLTALIGVSISPVLTPGWLYPRLIWGGIWGFLFALPILQSSSWILRGLILSLAPSAVQIFVVFPINTPAGMMGLGFGTLTPLVVLAVNGVWGLATAWWCKKIGG